MEIVLEILRACFIVAIHLAFFVQLEMILRPLLHRQKHITPDAVPPAGEGYMYVGHGATLFRLRETVVLTDPILTSRYAIFFRRFVSAGVNLADLSRVDVVLISHGHPDHNHPASLRVLARQNRHLTLLVPAGYARRYKYAKRYHFAQVIEVPRNDAVRVKDLIFTNVPADHSFSKGASGWMIQAPPSPEDAADPPATIYFAGDTAYNGDMFRAIASRGQIDLAFLPMGCYAGHILHLFRPSFGRVHMGPHEFPRAIADLHPRAVAPIHWGTFIIGTEPIHEAETRFRQLQAIGQIPPLAQIASHGTWHAFPG